MKLLYRAFAPVTFLTALLNPRTGCAQSVTDPLRFFQGMTETVGTLRVMLRDSVHTRDIGQGKIRSDGTLVLVQRVEEDGNRPHQRRWLIRQVAPGRFVGTMSEASGPVAIDKVGDRYRFRFKMSGNMSVEEWLTPLPGGRAAMSNMTARKFGIAVAHAQGIVRKVS